MGVDFSPGLTAKLLSILVMIAGLKIAKALLQFSPDEAISLHRHISEFVSECPFLRLAYGQGQMSADKQHGESRQPHRQISTTLVDSNPPLHQGLCCHGSY